LDHRWIVERTRWALGLNVRAAAQDRWHGLAVHAQLALLAINCCRDIPLFEAAERFAPQLIRN
jgi:hypothetical protein